MDLKELRIFFESEHQRSEDIDQFVLRTKEKELWEQMVKVKGQKAELAMQKKKLESELDELLEELRQERDEAMLAQREKQEIQQALLRIEAQKLTAAEFEKQRELQKLAHQKDEILMKEKRLLGETNNLMNSYLNKKQQMERQFNVGNELEVKTEDINKDVINKRRQMMIDS